MKYIKTFENKNHKYKVGDWVIINIEDYDYTETGEILELEYLGSREIGEDLAYIIDTYTKIPEELSYMQYGDENSTIFLAEEEEIKRRLNKKEIEKAKLEKLAKKYNI